MSLQELITTSTLTTDNSFFLLKWVSTIILSEKIASHEIIDLLKQQALQVHDFSGGNASNDSFRLDDGEPLIEKTMEHWLLPMRASIQSCAVGSRGQTIIHDVTQNSYDHDLVLVISKRTVFTKSWPIPEKISLMSEDLMIVGGGRIGEMVAKKA